MWIQCIAEYSAPKSRMAVPLGRSKAVLASFMKLQDISYRLFPPSISRPKTSL